MFDYGITYEEELEIKKEEGFLEAALKLLQKGTSFQDVISMLDLSDNQIGELKRRCA